MCRLYAFRANEPTKVECSLVHAQNALLTQSIRDARGVPNPDGWGIGYYQNNCPRIERRETAAHADEHFSVAAERVFAKSVLAHVRGATVGATGSKNTHPFAYGYWTFAHNGTVHGFNLIETRLARETDPDLLALRCGATDSEAVFYWLLTCMRHDGIDINGSVVDLGQLVRVMREAIAYLDSLCAEASPAEPARLNFVLTNGVVLLATRVRNTLYIVERQGVHDCEICGIPHIQHDDNAPYQAVVIASEKITHEDWRAVPDGSVVTIDGELNTQIHAI